MIISSADPYLRGYGLPYSIRDEEIGTVGYYRDGRGNETSVVFDSPLCGYCDSSVDDRGFCPSCNEYTEIA